jgi:MoxR-like ATPase
MAVKIDTARDRILSLGRELSMIFLGRDRVIRLILTATLAREPILFVGPPGTAKSMVVRAFCSALGLGDHEYFEYTLTRFSEPSELMGPVDIAELREGRYRRRIDGMLPTAQVAFLDEIFKANSAILNVLLTLINERRYYQDGNAIPVPLRMLFGASNGIPDSADLEALKDRFILKVETRPVRDTHFWELIDRGLDFDSGGDISQRLSDLPKVGVTMEDFDSVHDHMVRTALAGAGSHGKPMMGTKEVTGLFESLIKTIEHEEKVLMTDRRLVKLAKLVLTDAYLHGTSGHVEPENMYVLAYAGHNRRDLSRLEDRVFDRISREGGGSV